MISDHDRNEVMKPVLKSHGTNFINENDDDRYMPCLLLLLDYIGHQLQAPASITDASNNFLIMRKI